MSAVLMDEECPFCGHEPSIVDADKLREILHSLMPVIHEVALADLAADRKETTLAAQHMTVALKTFRSLLLRSPGMTEYLNWLTADDN